MPSPIDRILLTRFEEVGLFTPVAAVGYPGSLDHFSNHPADFMPPWGRGWKMLYLGPQKPVWRQRYPCGSESSTEGLRPCMMLIGFCYDMKIS